MRKSIALLPGIAGLAMAAMGIGSAPSVANVRSDIPPGTLKRRQSRPGKPKVKIRVSNFDPRINHRTGKPHEHRREIARNTTRAGSPERAAAYSLGA